MKLENLDKAHELKEMLDCVDNSLRQIEHIYGEEGCYTPLDGSFDLMDTDSQNSLFLSGAGVAEAVIESIKTILGKQKDKIIKQVEKL